MPGKKIQPLRASGRTYAVPQHVPVLQESRMSAGGACYIICFCDRTEMKKWEEIRRRNNLQTVKQAKQQTTAINALLMLIILKLLIYYAKKLHV
jgi:hypothetical protein